MRALLHIGIVTVFVLGGCGGGGDSGGGGPAQPPVDPATITSGNAVDIAAATLAASLQTDGLSEFAGLTVPTAALNEASQTLFATIGELRVAGTEQLTDTVMMSRLVVETETIECAFGGMVTVTVNVAEAGGLSAGDSISADYVDCSEVEGSVIDGTFTMTIRQLDGDLLSGQILLRVDLEVVDFTVIDGEHHASVDGMLSMSIDTRTPPVVTVTVTAPTLSVSGSVAGHTLTSFSSVQTIDESATTYTLEVSGSLTSSAFEGRVDFETTAVLESFGDGFAFSGELLVTGAGGATIAIMIVDSSGILLEIDLDGDGGVDETVETTWQELLSAA